MFVAAVGSDLNIENCKDISGDDDFAVSGSIFTADYTIGGFETLAANLAAAANSICGTELMINKTVSNSGVCSGETVQFTIQVTNTGGDYNFTAFNVHIEDVFPNGFSNIAFVGSAPAGASISGSTLTYNLASLAANATATVVVSATVDVPPGNFNNIATAIADNANQVSDNASVVSGYATETLTLSECAPVTVNGITYSSTGSYTQELTSAAGCDSILTINFTLKSATTGVEQAAACASYFWHGTTYTSSGQYTYTTVNAAGCDSVVTLYLNITPAPEQPTLACYQNATFNSTTCSWDVTGDMPAEPTGLACYQDAVFNTTNCSWDIVGTMPAQPSIACYESASFNGQTCSWDVTGDMPAQPSIACYESASFNGQ
ncbi:MAG TPA: DUF11 domain-containing protein, partial [Flavobacteriales bacterium]|nr:DUF11 domain-containing protein [Flavobacteriales bacterium]